MNSTTSNTSIPGITHHTAHVNGATIHYVSAGTTGSPILLIHGFPETWWTFHKLIPLLALNHRVFAVDLRGFGDSSHNEGDYDSTTSAEDLHQLIGQLGIGPVHLTGQDISGATVFRLAAMHPDDVRSFTAIEMGLAGFGLESLGDITHGGSWHIGVLAAPGIAEMLLVNHEREFLGEWAFPSMIAVQGAITDADIDEFVRTYSRPGGWRGAIGLYQSMLTEGDSIKAIAQTHPLTMPVLAVGAGGGTFTESTVRQITTGMIQSVQLEGVGHYVAMEAPTALSTTILDFLESVDRA
ncbi:alpha/beta hydrolase [Paenibacillus sp. J53TS2]|uniref:alpha/beta fold hydrolase n=1 Tax=Paenibacillus sp. J53TS2 TaxID=2807197 RepID=UPI001B136225|nr:alpha/beta hydrolase [Paenibacillus sp. J53TS2]GIP48792.1 alpha/beta hydrolase [Paenibacillus sp. J53TS2]